MNNISSMLFSPPLQGKGSLTIVAAVHWCDYVSAPPPPHTRLVERNSQDASTNKCMLFINCIELSFRVQRSPAAAISEFEGTHFAAGKFRVKACWLGSSHGIQ